MNAQNIVETLSGKGFSLWITSGRLMVRPKADDATRELLRQHKAAIVSYLAGQSGQKTFGEIPAQGKNENSGETGKTLATSDKALRRDQNTTESKTLADSKTIQPCSPNEGISQNRVILHVKAPFSVS